MEKNQSFNLGYNNNNMIENFLSFANVDDINTYFVSSVPNAQINNDERIQFYNSNDFLEQTREPKNLLGLMLSLFCFLCDEHHQHLHPSKLLSKVVENGTNTSTE